MKTFGNCLGVLFILSLIVLFSFVLQMCGVTGERFKRTDAQFGLFLIGFIFLILIVGYIASFFQKK